MKQPAEARQAMTVTQSPRHLPGTHFQGEMALFLAYSDDKLSFTDGFTGLEQGSTTGVIIDK